MDHASFLGLEVGSERGSWLLCTQREGSDWARELARARFLRFAFCVRSFVGLFCVFCFSGEDQFYPPSHL